MPYYLDGGPQGCGKTTGAFKDLGCRGFIVGVGGTVTVFQQFEPEVNVLQQARIISGTDGLPGRVYLQAFYPGHFPEKFPCQFKGVLEALNGSIAHDDGKGLRQSLFKGSKGLFKGF